eukprot:scaffold8136_cov127-Cylindrotheca_fusiformis.AAC.6
MMNATYLRRMIAKPALSFWKSGNKSMGSNLQCCFSTYYDSQSGMHVPVHNEQEISLILDKSKEDPSTTSFVPAQLYKEDPSSEMPDKLKELKEMGVAGVILPPVQFPRDQRNLKTLSAIAPENFMFFTSSVKNESSSPSSMPEGVSMIVDYAEEADSMEPAMKTWMESGSSTTIALRGGDAEMYNNTIATANRVAAAIDATGGGDFIWLSPASDTDEDEVVRLCEELVYLDLKGKTVKARMIVDSYDEDVVDETMFSGVNKYVIESEAQIGTVEEMATSQGKSILR